MRDYVKEMFTQRHFETLALFLKESNYSNKKQISERMHNLTSLDLTEREMSLMLTQRFLS